MEGTGGQLPHCYPANATPLIAFYTFISFRILQSCYQLCVVVSTLHSRHRVSPKRFRCAPVIYLERIHRRRSPTRNRNSSVPERLTSRRPVSRRMAVSTNGIVHVLIGSISTLSIWIWSRSWLSFGWHTWPTDGRTDGRADDVHSRPERRLSAVTRWIVVPASFTRQADTKRNETISYLESWLNCRRWSASGCDMR